MEFQGCNRLKFSCATFRCWHLPVSGFKELRVTGQRFDFCLDHFGKSPHIFGKKRMVFPIWQSSLRSSNFQWNHPRPRPQKSPKRYQSASKHIRCIPKNLEKKPPKDYQIHHPQVSLNQIHQNILLASLGRSRHWSLALHLLGPGDAVAVSSVMEAAATCSRWQLAVELLLG